MQNVANLKEHIRFLGEYRTESDDVQAALSLYCCENVDENGDATKLGEWFHELDDIIEQVEHSVQAVNVVEANPGNEDVMEKVKQFRRSRKEKLAKSQELSQLEKSIDAVRYAQSDDYKRVVELEIKYAKKSQSGKIMEKLQDSNYLQLHETLLDETKPESTTLSGGLLASRKFKSITEQITALPKVFTTLFLPRPEVIHSPRLVDHLDPELTERFRENRKNLFHPRLLPDLPMDLGRINGNVSRFVVEKELRTLHKLNWYRFQNDILILQWLLSKYVSSDELGEIDLPWLDEKTVVDTMLEQFWLSLHIHQSLHKTRCENALTGQGKTFGSVTRFISKEEPHSYLSEADKKKLVSVAQKDKRPVKLQQNHSGETEPKQSGYKGKHYGPNHNRKKTEEGKPSDKQ